MFCWFAPFLIRRVIYEIFSRDIQVAGKRLQRPSHTKHNSSVYFFGIFWYTIFTHFLAAGKNNARTLPQVVIERERDREGGEESCSSAAVPLPLLLLYSFPPSLSISLDGRRVHSSGRRRVHHQHRRGIFFSRSFVFAAAAPPSPTLSALASQSSNQPHLKYLWLLFD